MASRSRHLAVDPLEEGAAAARKRARDEVQAFDGLVVDEEQREDRNGHRDDELPRKFDLRPDGQDGLDQRRFLDHGGGSPQEARSLPRFPCAVQPGKYAANMTRARMRRGVARRFAAVVARRLAPAI